MSDVFSNKLEMLDVHDNDLRLQTPASICISGPSQSGKSHWITKLIKNRNVLFTHEFNQLYYCIPESLSLNPNPIFEEIKKAILMHNSTLAFLMLQSLT